MVEAFHQADFDAGADVVETNSFQASRLRLEEWGLADKTLAMNRAAAEIARRVADRVAAAEARRRFDAGWVGPSGMGPSSEDPALGRRRANRGFGCRHAPQTRHPPPRGWRGS